MREDIKERIGLIKELKCPSGYIETQKTFFPIDWDVKSLNYVIKGEVRNGTFNDPNKQGKGIKIINVGDLYTEGTIESVNLARVDLEETIIEKNLVNYGDILCTRSSIKKNGVGKCNIYLSDEKVIYDSHIIKFSIDTTILDPYYVYLFLNTYFVRKQIMLCAKTTTMTTIGQEEIRKIKIAFPKLNEQKKIVKIIKKYNLLIENQKRYINENKRKRKYLMYQLLEEKSLKKENWEKIKMENVFSERIETKIINAELLSITSHGIIPRIQVEGKDVSSVDKSKYKRICKGDIGYNTMRMWQGVSAFSEYDGIVSPAYTVLIPHNNIDAKFFSYLFKLPSSIFKFYRYSQGLVNDTKNLKYENFKKVSFRCPSDVKEQRLIAKILNKVDKEIELLEKKLELIKQEKKAMMQLLLTGIVRINGE